MRITGSVCAEKANIHHQRIYTSFENVNFVCKHANDLLTLKASSNRRKLSSKGFSQADADEINDHLNLCLQHVVLCF